MDCSPPWNFLGKNTGVGCHSLIQGIFLSQGSNLGLPHCRQILYLLSRQGNTFNISFAFIYLSGCVRLRHMGALLCYGGYFFVAHRPSSCGTWTLVAVAHGLSCTKACGSLVPHTGIEPAFLALQGRFLTPRTTRKVLLYFLLYSIFILFWLQPLQHAELPWLGIKPVPPTVGAWSLNHWTSREASLFCSLSIILCNNPFIKRINFPVSCLCES